MGYWSNITRTRLGRRQVLSATAAGATAAAFLAACGGDDGESRPSATNGTNGSTGPTSSTGPISSTGGSGLVTLPVDRSDQARYGGVLREVVQGDPSTLDPINQNNALTQVAGLTYGTLVAAAPGHMKPADASLMGDLAESWEVSPDGLKISLKLRQGVTWHNRAPVNGRLVDAEDVLASWGRFSQLSPSRFLVYNDVEPSAPVLSMSSPDQQTIVLDLKDPVIYALGLFAGFGSFTGNMIMTPKETGDTFDIRGDMIGHGPFELVDYTPSAHFHFKRNANYYDKEFAYVDSFEQTIIPEYAAQLAQFMAGNVDQFVPRGEDVLTAKSDKPRIDLYATDLTADVSAITFGQLPEGESPFLDERVRQAFSMVIDRDLWIDARYNTSAFRAEGLPQETRWNTHLGAQWDGWWLDPKSQDFGPNRQFFHYDLDEAKKLLTAAGYPDGFEMTSHYPAVNFILTGQMEPLDGMLGDLGIRVKVDAITDYFGYYIPTIRDGKGQFEGWGAHTVAGTTTARVDPVLSLVSEHWTRSSLTFHGYSISGKNDGSGDPVLDSMLEKARIEADVEARRSLVHEVQRHLGKAMHSMPMPGGASGFSMAWPHVQNKEVWRGGYGSRAYKLWIDETKRA